MVTNVKNMENFHSAFIEISEVNPCTFLKMNCKKELKCIFYIMELICFCQVHFLHER